MQKISAEQAAQVYSEVPGVLMSLVTERDKLAEDLQYARERLYAYEQDEKIQKIARAMDDKGVSPGESYDDHVDRIKQACENGKSLDVIEEAVDMTTPNGALAKLASDVTVPGGMSKLEAYLRGEID